MKKLFAVLLMLALTASMLLSASALEAGDTIYLQLNDEEHTHAAAAFVLIDSSNSNKPMSAVAGAEHLYSVEIPADTNTVTLAYINTNQTPPSPQVVCGPTAIADLTGNLYNTATGAWETYPAVPETPEKNIVITGDTAADITVKYAEGEQIDAYAATITWGSMEFTYQAAEKTWNTETLAWEGTDAGWVNDGSENAGTVSIENRSSQPITAKFSFTAEAEAYGVTGVTVNGAAIAAEGYEIASAVSGTAQTETFVILPTGTYTGTNTDAVKVGSLTVTLE